MQCMCVCVSIIQMETTSQHTLRNVSQLVFDLYLSFYSTSFFFSVLFFLIYCIFIDNFRIIYLCPFFGNHMFLSFFFVLLFFSSLCEIFVAPSQISLGKIKFISFRRNFDTINSSFYFAE